EVLIMTKTLLLGAIALVAACERNNANYCADHPDHNCNEPIDGANNACTAVSCTSGVCDTTSGMCVQCTANQAAACQGTTPICGANDACRGCQLHSECTSMACLPDGSCADGTAVAYVASVAQGGTVNPDCTQGTPCTLISTAVATGRPYVRVKGT